MVLYKYQKAYRKRQKEKVRKLVGDKCIICGNSKRRIAYHEIHGKPHRTNYGEYSYILDHPQDFVSICCRCHNVLHYLLNLGQKRKEIFKFLKQLIDGEKAQSLIRALASNTGEKK